MDNFIKKEHPTCKLPVARLLLLFGKSTLSDQFGKILHILRRQHWIMNQQLVTIVTKRRVFTLPSPGALLEYSFPRRVASIRRATKKTLGDEVVLAGMSAAIDC